MLNGGLPLPCSTLYKEPSATLKASPKRGNLVVARNVLRQTVGRKLVVCILENNGP